MEKGTAIFGEGKQLPTVQSAGYPCAKSEVYPCEQCGKAAVMLIHTSAARLHDYMQDLELLPHSLMMDMNVLTWVLGPERQVVINGQPEGLAIAMQIWPKRMRAKAVLSSEFKTLIAELMYKHCQTN